MEKPANSFEVWADFHELATFLEDAFLGETLTSIEIQSTIEKGNNAKQPDPETE